MAEEQLRVAFATLRTGDEATKRMLLTALRHQLLLEPRNFPLLRHLLPSICELEVCN